MGTQSRIRVRPDKQKRDRTADESKIATVVAATPTPGEIKEKIWAFWLILLIVYFVH